MRKLALYLPQYHTIKENDEWWGKGYTEWTAVRNAKPLFKGHDQPKIPYDHDYYDLSDESAGTWNKQAIMAKNYGVDGFCIYHYWFETGKQLLEKPAEILLRHPEIELPYCFSWANETWTRTWYGNTSSILMEQKYLGKEEWKNHFDYLLQFFKDERYIKVNNRPMFCIYQSWQIDCLREMISSWNEWACEAGFDGMYIVSANSGIGKHDYREDVIDAYYNHEPGFTEVHKTPSGVKLLKKAKTVMKIGYNKAFHKNKLINLKDIRITYKYINRKIYKSTKPEFKGVFPHWDNTPRRGILGCCYTHSSPAEFDKALSCITTDYHEEFIFINAWNEWGEGCYLEPDVTSGFEYLDVLKKY